MRNIILVDPGVDTSEPPIYVEKGEFPIVRGQIAAGEYRVLNTAASEPGTVTAPVGAPDVATVPTQTIVQGSSGSLDLSQYASGGATPYSYALQVPVNGFSLSGSTLNWSIAADATLATGSVAVTVTGANDLSNTISVPYEITALEPELVSDTSLNLFRAMNISEVTPVAFSAPDRYAGTGEIDPSAAGPQLIGNVTLKTASGNPPAVGERVIADVGPWASEYPSISHAVTIYSDLDEVAIDNELISYVIQDTDAGKSISAGVVGSDPSGSSTQYGSNGLTIPIEQGWWIDNPNLFADIDYANDRARINGVSYESLAAAETAGAIKTDGSVKYIDVATGAELTLAASGTAVRNTTVPQALVNLDDNADADISGNSNNLIFYVNASAKAAVYSKSGGTNHINSISTTSYGEGAVLSMAATVRSTSPTGRIQIGAETFDRPSIPAPVGITRMVLGAQNNTYPMPWLGTKKRIVLINGPMTDAELATLQGSI